MRNCPAGRPLETAAATPHPGPQPAPAGPASAHVHAASAPLPALLHQGRPLGGHTWQTPPQARPDRSTPEPPGARGRQCRLSGSAAARTSPLPPATPGLRTADAGSRPTETAAACGTAPAEQKGWRSRRASVPGSLEERTESEEGRGLRPGPSASPQQGAGRGRSRPESTSS